MKNQRFSDESNYFDDLRDNHSLNLQPTDSRVESPEERHLREWEDWQREKIMFSRGF